VSGATPPKLSAVVLAYNRVESVRVVLGRLASLPIDEVVVADNGSSDGTPELVRRSGRNVTLLELDGNVGVAARNLGVERARGELILMLDDDSYPLPGTLEHLIAAFERAPGLGIAGGRVIDVDAAGTPVGDGTGPGSFDWYLRPHGRSDAPAEGFPASFFAQGACVVRRTAFLDVGGCFAPYFFREPEPDLTARMIAAGWDVRYFPEAAFEHRRERAGRGDPATRQMLRYRIRNQIWYFWLRFPITIAARRIPLYLAFDLAECAYRGELGAWTGAIADAWAQRALIRGQRRPLPRSALRRAELDRGRKHIRRLALGLRSRVASRA
jgi:GT2 family glycosyltransferase